MNFPYNLLKISARRPDPNKETLTLYKLEQNEKSALNAAFIHAKRIERCEISGMNFHEVRHLYLKLCFFSGEKQS